MEIQAKYLKPGQKFKFKYGFIDPRIINEFIKDDRLEMHFKNSKGTFTSDYYNEIVILL